MDIQLITNKVEKESVIIRRIMSEIEKVIVGQKNLLEKMLIGLICDGIYFLRGFRALQRQRLSGRLLQRLTHHFREFNLHPIFFLQIFSVCRFSVLTVENSRNTRKGPSSII